MEMEVKILDIDIEDVRKRMKEAGAMLVKDEDQENRIFDFPDGRLLKERGYARLRNVKDRRDGSIQHTMTTKRMLSQEKYKVMDEHETVISSGEEGEGIFLALGLQLSHVIRKSRESYRYKDTLVEIDINEKEFFPVPYLEVESASEAELEETVSLLGYTMADATSRTMYEIMRDMGLVKGDDFGF